MRVQIISLLAVFITATSSLFSQQQIIDSLKVELTKKPKDSVKIKMYSDLCWYYRNISSDSALVYGNKALELSKNTSNNSGEAQAFNDLGIIKYSLGDYNAANLLYNNSLSIRKLLNDTLGMAALYNKIGLCHQNMFAMDSAIHYATKALKIYEEKDKVPYANMLKTNIANIYKNLKQYDKALEMHLEVAESNMSNNDMQGLTRSYNNIANAYLFLQDTVQCLSYYKKGIEVAEKHNYVRELSALYNNYGGLLSDLDRYKEAIPIIEKSLVIREQLQDVQGVASSSLNLGTLYLELGNLGKVEAYLRKGLKIAEDINANEFKMDAYDKLSSYYAYRRMPDSVIHFKEQFKAVKDSIFSSRVTKEVAEVREKYEAAEREKQILSQRAALAEKELDINKKNSQMLGLGILAVVLGLLGYLFYNQQKIKNTQLQKENELKAALLKIETQNKLQNQRLRISRDLHDNIGAQLTFIISSLDNLKYGFKIPDKLTDKLKSISGFTSSTIEELRDTIWAMNKSDITLEDLEMRISNFIAKADLATDEVDFSVNMATKLNRNQQFSSVVGMNIYRIIQEAVNNSLKYSESNSIKVDVSNENGGIKFQISDDGKGFDIESIEFGNGLNNMRKRASDIGAEIEITSEKKQGTSVVLKL